MESNKTTQPVVVTRQTNQYILTKSKLAHHMKYDFVIPVSLQPELSEYKTVFWSVDYFITNCQQGKLARHGIKWLNVVYQDCTRGEILRLATQFKNAQIKLSFRQARKHWNLPAYVIVKIAAIKPQLRLNEQGSYYVKD